MEMIERIEQYISTLDSAIDVLSKHNEYVLFRLPHWYRAHRKITLGTSPDGSFHAVRIEHDGDLTQDQYITVEMHSHDDVNSLLAPIFVSEGHLHIQDDDFVMPMGGFQVHYDTSYPRETTSTVYSGLSAIGRTGGITNQFSINAAKKDAVDDWRCAANIEYNKHASFIETTQSVFDTLRAIIKLKAFKERRIHRYIYHHRGILLPPHHECFTEHRIFLGDDYRDADLVLKMEDGAPALLIELEAPTWKIFRKDGHFRQEVNHAKEQIAEWVRFIDNDKQKNCSGEFTFLSLPKRRLVIIGRGLEHAERLIQTARDDTTVWTYDVLISMAVDRANVNHESVCRVMGVELTRPFR